MWCPVLSLSKEGVKEGGKLYKTSIRFTKAEIKFAKIYRLDPPKAMRVLWDLYFYTGMFKKAMVGKKKPYSRVRALLFMEHGIALSGQTIKRWYKCMDKNKRPYE